MAICVSKMKKKKKIEQKNRSRKLPEGLIEFLAAFAVIALIVVIVFCTRSCAYGETIDPSLTSGVYEDTSAPAKDSPTTTILNPIPVAETISYPLALSEGLTLDKVYTATGYFPEDGSEESIENVLAVKLTNKSEKTLEYLTFTLDANGETFKFSAATIPAGKSVYAFNLDRKAAPKNLDTVECATEFEIYFAKEPSAKTDMLSYDIKNGTVVVTNISGRDIKSDIVVYYKATAEDGYLGGITYRFRISGGLAAGKSFNAYAPHALTHMTEIMFAQYEE